MTAHRYWKVGDMTSGDGSLLNVAECYLRATVGGANQIPTASTQSSGFTGGDVASLTYDGNPATVWTSNFGDEGTAYLAYDYGSAVSVAQMMLQTRGDAVPDRAPYQGNVYYSDTGLSGPWTLFSAYTFSHPWTLGQIQTYNFPVNAATINATKAAVLTVMSRTTPTIKATSSRILGAMTIAGSINVTMGKVLGVVTGRVGQPNLVAWTFTLDGHDFYALRLGDNMTLIYDQNTQQWAEWGEDINLGLGNIDTLGRWAISTGLNWPGITPLSNSMGSNVVAGDDSLGAIYVFDPGFDEDYKPTTGGTTSFHRFAQGEILVKGRDAVPVWGVRLSGAVGEQWTGALVNVELQSSDDMGNSYFSNGIVQVPKNSLSFRLDWNSLGSMNTPGRLFKIIDDGAIVRLDALDYYDRDNPS